ncbi:hypothetical protein NVV37_24425, partial [Escherichia coli]|nr:hypothetical protein [Escherichia coli]
MPSMYKIIRKTLALIGIELVRTMVLTRNEWLMLDRRKRISIKVFGKLFGVGAVVIGAVAIFATAGLSAGAYGVSNVVINAGGEYVRIGNCVDKNIITAKMQVNLPQFMSDIFQYLNK